MQVADFEHRWYGGVPKLNKKGIQIVTVLDKIRENRPDSWFAHVMRRYKEHYDFKSDDHGLGI